MGKGSFIVYDVDLESLNFLTDKQAGCLFHAIADYRLEGKEPDFGKDSTLKVLFHQITQHIEINEEKYKALSIKRSEAAKKRWNKNACAYDALQSDAKQCLYDNDTVNDTVTVNDTETVNDTDNVACGAKKKTKENNYYNKKNNIPKLLQDDPAYDIEAFERKAIGLKYQKKDNAQI